MFRRFTGRFFVLLLGCVLWSAAVVQPVHGQTDEPAAMPTRLEGYLKLMEPGLWWVGDERVIVNAQTVVIEKRGRAEVSAWLVVQGQQTATGQIEAQFVIVERPAGRYGIVWPFSGILMKQAGDLWVIDNTLVRVTPETSVSGAPQPGWLVWVIAEQPSDALEPRAIAIEAIADSPAQVPVQFEGVLEATEPEWRVSGHTFRLSEQPVRIGEPVIGQTVEVEAIVQPDGSLIAHLIRAVDTSADARLSALVADIVAQPDGEQIWDLIVFPPDAWAEPYIGAAHVGANTLVDQSRAVAQPGQWVEVQGISIGQNEFQADVIRLDQPVPAAVSGELRLVKLAGADGGITRTWWTVDGTPLWIEEDRLARCASMIESEVIIRGVRLGNGVLRVERITPVTGMMH